MLLLDPRTGSGDLAPHLRALGLPTELVQLEYGDCAFMGTGVGGAPMLVGVEIKKLSDILQCIETGRFSGHQLPGLVATYDYAVLLIEGIYRANPHDGILQIMQGKEWRAASFGRRSWMYRDFVKFLLTQAIRGGITVWQTSSREETARYISALYGWWQDGIESHESHLAMDRTLQLSLKGQAMKEQGVSLLAERVNVPFIRRVAAELPGVGVEKSQRVVEHFEGSLTRMMCAGEKEWQEIDGIGPKTAKRIVSELK